MHTVAPLSSWLFSGELWWHDILRLVFNGFIGFLTVAGLTSLFKGKIANWLSPFTPGGVGDTTDEEGTPAHRLLSAPKVHPPPGGKPPR